MENREADGRGRIRSAMILAAQAEIEADLVGLSETEINDVIGRLIRTLKPRLNRVDIEAAYETFETTGERGPLTRVEYALAEGEALIRIAERHNLKLAEYLAEARRNRDRSSPHS